MSSTMARLVRHRGHGVGGESRPRAVPRATARTSATVTPVGWMVDGHMRLSVEQNGADQRDARPVGQVQVGLGASRMARSARAPTPRCPMSSRRSARAPPAVAAHSASAGRHPHLADRQRDAERHRRWCTTSRGCSRWPAPRWPRRRAAGARRGTATGWRTRPRAAAWPRSPSRPARRRRRRTGGCSGRRWPRRARPRAARPAPAVSWLACIRGSSPAAIPARQHRPGLVAVEGAPLAEHVDPAGVRRGGGQHRRRRPGRRSRRRPVELGRHHVRAQERGLRR